MIASPYREQHRTRTAGAVWDAPFPFTSIFQNGPRRQGSAPPRSTRAPRGCPGAPLTAPGRSKETSPQRRERGQTEKRQPARLPLVGPEPNPEDVPNLNRRDEQSQLKLTLAWMQVTW
jgi:hypothetical protein